MEVNDQVGGKQVLLKMVAAPVAPYDISEVRARQQGRGGGSGAEIRPCHAFRRPTAGTLRAQASCRQCVATKVLPRLLLQGRT